MPLFFCDVCDIPGITLDIGLRAFKACLDAGERGILRGVFDWAESAGVPSHAAELTRFESLESAMKGTYEASQEHGVGTVGTVDTPAIIDVGYVDNASKEAHAVQLLVHVSNGRAIVGIANTGDGALAISEGKATVVALGSTTEREARALLAMAVRVRLCACTAPRTPPLQVCSSIRPSTGRTALPTLSRVVFSLTTSSAAISCS